MRRAQHLGHPGQPVRDQEGPAAHRQQRHRRRLGLHAVHRLLQHPCRQRQRLGDKLWRQPRDPRRVTQRKPPRGDGDVARGQVRPAEHQRPFRQPEPDAARPDRERVPRHQRTAAEPEGIQIRHAEQGPHAADMHHRIRLPREAMAERADVAGGAAHIHHQRILHAGQEGGAAHGIRRAGGEGQHREARRQRRADHRAIVLRDIERRGDPRRRQRRLEGRDGQPRQRHQRGVQQRDILPLQQPDPPQLMGQRDGGLRHLLPQDLRRAKLHPRVERGEDGRDSDAADARGAHRPRRRCHARLIERHDRPAVIIMPALDHMHLPAHLRGQILRPVTEGRQGGGGGQPDPQRADLGEVPPLHHRIDEMGGADHHRLGIRPARRRHRLQRAPHAGQHILGGRGLGGEDHARAIQQHRIGVGAADIDADTPHASRPAALQSSGGNTLTKSMSCPKARGPTWSSPFGVRNTAGARRAITVTRWP